MEVTQIKPQNSGGFKLYGKVLEITKHEGRDALSMVQISGKEQGREFKVVLKDDPNYKGKKFDDEGLTALKIKKGVNVGFTNCEYLGAKENGIIETRRAHKVGRDFRPDQSLVISAFAQRMDRLTGSIIEPKKGVHGVLPKDARRAALVTMFEKVLPTLGDTQGILLAVNGKAKLSAKGPNGEDTVDEIDLTVHNIISRYHKEDANTESRLLTAEEFKEKALKFINSDTGRLINFDGTIPTDLKNVLNSKEEINALIVPSEGIPLTGAKFLDNQKSAITTGVGSMGVGIDPSNSEREFPIIQAGMMEMSGHLGFRSPGPNNEPFGGPKVRPDNGQAVYARMVYQIDAMNGVTRDQTQSETNANEPPVISQPEVPDTAHTADISANSFDAFDDEDPFAEPAEETGHRM